MNSIQIHKRVFSLIKRDIFDYFVHEKPQELGYAKLVSTFQNKPVEMNIKVTSIEPYEETKFKVNFIKEEPTKKETPKFTQDISYDFNEWD